LRTIELEALQIFKAVVDYGGVTRAAAQLHRVPSNVTTRLKQLEEGLGTKLFHRHSRKPLLSSEGNLLLTYAEQLLRLSSEAELALRTGKPRGKLRIGTLESTAAIALVPHSVVHPLHAERELSVLPLPNEFMESTTFLVWPKEHPSAALDAFTPRTASGGRRLNTSREFAIRGNVDGW